MFSREVYSISPNSSTVSYGLGYVPVSLHHSAEGMLDAYQEDVPIVMSIKCLQFYLGLKNVSRCSVYLVYVLVCWYLFVYCIILGYYFINYLDIQKNGERAEPFERLYGIHVTVCLFSGGLRARPRVCGFLFCIYKNIVAGHISPDHGACTLSITLTFGFVVCETTSLKLAAFPGIGCKCGVHIWRINPFLFLHN